MQIEQVSNNANLMLGFLRINFRPVLLSLKLFICELQVKSKLEHADSASDLGIAYLTSSLESIQNESASFILSKSYS